MKAFEPLQWDAGQCRKELVALQKLLASSASLKEREDILPFFKARRHLSGYLASYHADIINCDRLAYEFDLFGDFACDVAVGDSERGAYGFVEFEDASPNSIFVKKRGKSSPEWSPRFDHGFSQLIDWFCKLHDMEKTDDFEAKFGGRSIRFFGLLVVGRTEPLAAREVRRLKWREERVVINSNKIRCLTFDQLCADLLARMETFLKRAAGSGGK
jgi:hypothetical protein